MPCDQSKLFWRFLFMLIDLSTLKRNFACQMPLVDRIENGSDTIRILLTTDNHVGCFENDPIRGNDGWKTFDEITQIAKDQDVDMLVQGVIYFISINPQRSQCITL